MSMLSKIGRAKRYGLNDRDKAIAQKIRKIVDEVPKTVRRYAECRSTAHIEVHVIDYGDKNFNNKDLDVVSQGVLNELAEAGLKPTIVNHTQETGESWKETSATRRYIALPPIDYNNIPKLTSWQIMAGYVDYWWGWLSANFSPLTIIVCGLIVVAISLIGIALRPFSPFTK